MILIPKDTFIELDMPVKVLC